MSDYNIQIHTMEGNTQSVQVAPDTSVEELFQDVIDFLQLPRRDAEGQPISWSLFDKDIGQDLQQGLSVEESGVREGHHLHLRRATVAGRAEP